MSHATRDSRWSEIRDGFQSQLPITTLTIDPRNHQTVYAGTGNGGFNGYFGNGIYKSLDGGANWKPVNSSDEYLDPSHVQSVVMDPAASQTLYATTIRGGGLPGNFAFNRFFKTTTAGGRWLLAGQLPDDFFVGVYTTALQEGEVITAVRFPIPAQAGWQKFKQPASRFALVGVFVAKGPAGVRVVP